MFNNAREVNQFLIRSWVQAPRLIIDATLGQGLDTEFLHRLFPQAQIYAFDIQDQALARARARLGQPDEIHYIRDSHSRLGAHVPGPVDFAIFNLGYLPGGDKTITTQGEEVVGALDQLLPLLTPGGLVSLTLYPGHEPGRREAQLVQAYLQGLDQGAFTVSQISFCNQRNHPPYCLWVEKRRA